MAFESVTGYCWPQSIAHGRQRRAAPVVVGRSRRARRDRPRRCARARWCGPTRSPPATTRRRHVPASDGLRLAGSGGGVPPAPTGAAGTTRWSSHRRGRQAAHRPRVLRAPSAGRQPEPDPAPARHEHLVRVQRLRRHEPVHRRRRTSSLQRPMARGYLHKPPGAGRRVTTTHPPDPDMNTHVGYLRRHHLSPLRRLRGLARLGAAVPRLGGARGLRRSTCA